MRIACPSVVDLARRLVRNPAPGEVAASGIDADLLAQHCESLRPRISQLVGREGYRALLSRALALAQGELPWLGGTQVGADGSLTGLDEAVVGQIPEVREAGCALVLAHLLGLLVAFIGVELTRRLVNGAWPDAHVEHTDLGKDEGEV